MAAMGNGQDDKIAKCRRYGRGRYGRDEQPFQTGQGPQSPEPARCPHAAEPPTVRPPISSVG